jgi:hypothetical protein
VHVTGSGVCRIWASQPGNERFYAALPVMQAFGITDVIMPTALPTFGNAGAIVRLHYRISSTGIVKTTVVVRRNGSVVARVGRTGDVISGHVYGVGWHSPPAASRARFSFCVTVLDRQSLDSFTSCAPIGWSGPSAAADRRDHVDARAVLDRCVEGRSLAVHVDVDVLPQSRARLAEPVAEARPAAVELVDRLVHGRRVDLHVPRQVGEERGERGGQVEVGHDYWMTATSTDHTGGR